MARIRTIKPEFHAHEELSSLPAETHLLAAALINYADDEGYFNANPVLVKAGTNPLRTDKTKLEDQLAQLEAIGYIEIRRSGVRHFGKVLNFDEHQRVSHASPSKIKSKFEELQKSSGAAPEPLRPELNRRELNLREQGITSRDKREPDTRHTPFKLACEAYFKFHRMTMTWDASEAKKLSAMLAANPELTLAQFQALLNHRSKSPVNHAERPRAWLERITDYAAGPLNQFKQPEGTSNVRKSAVAQNLEDLQDIARRLDEADGRSGCLVSESANREADPNDLHDGMARDRRTLLATAV